MKYEKPEVEVVAFDFSEFMLCSSNPVNPGPQQCTGYTDSVGHTCGTYTQGSGCSSWTSPGFGGATCSSFDGKKCYGYTDSTHSNCQEYGYTCGKF